QEAVLNVARYDLDGLREALLSGDVARLTRTLDGLQHEGEPPPLVLWAMTEEVRALAQVKAGLRERKNLDALLKDARIWGARQQFFKRAVQRVNDASADAALLHAAQIDRMIKGIGSGDIWNEFLRLGLGLCSA
ncbi:MAG: DNA polymerase III subunit delta, partial [Betaproteobacteria bacterium]